MKILTTQSTFFTFLFLSFYPIIPVESTIFIYADEGTSLFCIECLKRDLKGYKVRTITANEVISSDWDKEASLFIMPGGRDVPYTEKLNGAGNARIWKYVNDGGHYLGFCAGAYYGSGFVNFDQGTPLQVQGPRELAFFPGTAKGPAYRSRTYSYKNRSGAKASLIERVCFVIQSDSKNGVRTSLFMSQTLLKHTVL